MNADTPAPPVDRRRRRTARTREKIEAAALELFTEQGFATTTVEQIAEAADIAPRTFFRHFPSKDSVLFGDRTRELERVRTVVSARPAGEHVMRSFAIALLDAAERMELDREQHLLRARLLADLEIADDYEFHLLRQRWVEDMASLISERLGTRNHSDPRPVTWAMVLMSCFASALHTWLSRTDGLEFRQALLDVLRETASGLDAAVDGGERRAG
ncbi:TetR family transcriptional regulator [Parasphingorhabdus pacifica]